MAAIPASLSQPLRDAASAGDVGAEFELGLRLLDGRGVARDPHAAAQWLEQAAEPRPADRRIPPRRALRKGHRRDARSADRDVALRQGRDRRQRAGDAQSRGHARRGLDQRQAGLRDGGGMVPQGRPVRRARQPVQSRHPLRARPRRAAGPRPGVAVVLARRAAGRRGRRPQARRHRRQDGSGGGQRRGRRARRLQDSRRRSPAANEAPTPPGGWDGKIGLRKRARQPPPSQRRRSKPFSREAGEGGA